MYCTYSEQRCAVARDSTVMILLRRILSVSRDRFSLRENERKNTNGSGSGVCASAPLMFEHRALVRTCNGSRREMLARKVGKGKAKRTDERAFIETLTVEY